MYSRQNRGKDPSLRVPENYSGCAFSESKGIDVPPRFLEVAKPTPEDYTPPPAPPLPPPRKEAPHPPTPSLSPLPISKNPFPLLGGLEFDQLLILGLIFLLSRGEEGNDVLIWLILLLFCG